MIDRDRTRPLHVEISQEVLSDLRSRVMRTRWPHEPDDAEWQYGINLEYLRELSAYWIDGFDWLAAQRRMNETEHFMVSLTDATGQRLWVHVERVCRGRDERTPILMTPGWPSCFLEYQKLRAGLQSLGRTVYIADLPGFGLSPPPPRPMAPRALAALWRYMMTEVFQHPSFFAHGSDWGSVVASWLGVDHPEAVAGIHLTMLGLKPAAGGPLSDVEKSWLKETQGQLALDPGYRELQATKPTTLAVGLADSPVALAGWMAEKYLGWSGGVQRSGLSMDDLLQAITLYWSTGNIASANWIYWADRQDRSIALAPLQRCEVPTGFIFSGDGFFPSPPDAWVNRAYNVVDRQDFARGGHFPALTQPKQFLHSLTGFLAQLEPDQQ